MRTMNLTFDDLPFEKLKAAYESAKKKDQRITKLEDFIYRMCVPK